MRSANAALPPRGRPKTTVLIETVGSSCCRSMRASIVAIAAPRLCPVMWTVFVPVLCRPAFTADSTALAERACVPAKPLCTCTSPGLHIGPKRGEATRAGERTARTSGLREKCGVHILKSDLGIVSNGKAEMGLGLEQVKTFEVGSPKVTYMSDGSVPWCATTILPVTLSWPTKTEK
jgi:hypothetical protein